MTVRAVEGKKLWTGGKAIDVDRENKVISLRLRSENNLIIRDQGDNEIYVDLQLPDEIRPTDYFPVGITTGRVIEDNGWDWQGTVVCFKTTSGDNIKLLYADDGKLYIDNGTGTFKQIYLKGEVDALLQALREYIDQQTAFKPFPAGFDTTHTTQDFLDSIADLNLDVGSAFLGQISTSDMPSGVTVQGDVEVYVYPQNVIYAIMRSANVSPYVWECNSFNYRGWEAMSGGATYTAGAGINIQNNQISTDMTYITTIDTTAPSNPVAGQFWLDTYNYEFKIYDGMGWLVIAQIQPPL